MVPSRVGWRIFQLKRKFVNLAEGAAYETSDLAQERHAWPGCKHDQERLDRQSIADRRYGDRVDGCEVGKRQIDRQELDKAPILRDGADDRKQKDGPKSARANDQVERFLKGLGPRRDAPE